MSLRRRRTSLVIVAVLCIAAFIAFTPDAWYAPTTDVLPAQETVPLPSGDSTLALAVLEQLPVKGRAPKTGYVRAQFGNGWASRQGCDTRNIILARDLEAHETNEKCQVTQGTLHDPYTGKVIEFVRGPESSQAVQIDHVVALSNAWQTGAQELSEARRIALANDPLNLLAVDGTANQAKGDADAATWLPPQHAFRCQYVARQIAVKHAYNLWVVPAEREAMQRVLGQCPSQQLPHIIQS